MSLYPAKSPLTNMPHAFQNSYTDNILRYYCDPSNCSWELARACRKQLIFRLMINGPIRWLNAGRCQGISRTGFVLLMSFVGPRLLC